MRPALKICGVTLAADVGVAVAQGVEYVGFNLWPGSKRFITAAAAREAWIQGQKLAPGRPPASGPGATRAAAVFVNPAPGEVKAAVAAFPELAVLQLHGEEAPERLAAFKAEAGSPARLFWKALGVGAPGDLQRAAAFAAPAAGNDAWDLILFDVKATAGEAPGGTGRRFNWAWLESRPQGVAFGLAGGIKVDDIAPAAKTGAALIDICSGVEKSPGVKDHALMERARAALAALAVWALLFAGFTGATFFAQASSATAQEPAPQAKPEPPMANPPEATNDADGTDLAPLPDAAAAPLTPLPPGKSATDAPPPTAPVFKPTQVLSLQELHRWDRHVRGFRREHNFAFSAGVSSGTWAVKHFGTIENRKFDNSGLWTKFQYSFHLPIYRGFGYLLGSSAGYHYESTDRRRPFKPVPAVLFPGVLAGLVLNFNPVFRWSLAADYYLERHNGIEERDGQGDDPEIHVTLQSFDAMSLIDIFYDLNWAIRVETHYRNTQFMRPKKPEGFPVNANIKKTDQWLGIGLVYHLL